MFKNIEGSKMKVPLEEESHLMQSLEEEIGFDKSICYSLKLKGVSEIVL